MCPASTGCQRRVILLRDRQYEADKGLTSAFLQVVPSRSRSEAVLETLTRILLLPLHIAVFLIELPERVIYREPEGYGLCKWAEPYCEGAGQTCIPLVTEKCTFRSILVRNFIGQIDQEVQHQPESAFSGSIAEGERCSNSSALQSQSLFRRPGTLATDLKAEEVQISRAPLPVNLLDQAYQLLQASVLYAFATPSSCTSLLLCTLH